MLVTPASSTSATLASGRDSAIGALDGTSFLQLLVAQLQNQNPLSPMDNHEFMAQMAQFSSLEKLQSIERLLSTSAAGGELGLAASLVGRQVDWLDAQGEPQSGTAREVIRHEGTTSLLVGDALVPLADIVRVAAVPPPVL